MSEIIVHFVVPTMMWVGGLLVGYGAGLRRQRFRDEEHAIANGVAEYYLDENNERKFRWKK